MGDRILRHTRISTVVTVFVLVVGLVGLWRFTQSGAPRPELKSPTSTVNSQSVTRAPAASVELASVPPTLAPAGPGSRVAMVPESPGSRVARLTLSSKMDDKFVAYRLIRTCLDARDAAVARAQAPVKDREAYPDEVKACEAITAAQIVSRIGLLKSAAEAGVHGAASAFTIEGPDGMGIGAAADLTSAPAIEWHRLSMQYFDKGASTGDRASLLALSSQFQNGVPAVGDMVARDPDPMKALAYWVANYERQFRSKGVSEWPGGKVITSQLAQALTPEQTTQAIAQGKAMAARSNSIERGIP